MIADRDPGDEDDGLGKRLDAGTASRQECVDFITAGLTAALAPYKGQRGRDIVRTEMERFLVEATWPPTPTPAIEGWIVLEYVEKET